MLRGKKVTEHFVKNIFCRVILTKLGRVWFGFCWGIWPNMMSELEPVRQPDKPARARTHQPSPSTHFISPLTVGLNTKIMSHR